MRRMTLATLSAIVLATAVLPAQRGAGMAPEQQAQRWQLEKELQSIAVVERKVMVPMRDGVRLATDVYRPRGTGRSRRSSSRHRTTSITGTFAMACPPT
jgi:uncharacterized protein